MSTRKVLRSSYRFIVYQLRTSYLSHIKDGVGERLINVTSSVLNSPAFRASGWHSNASDIKRTYSPPIPTAVTAEYFQAPRNAAQYAGSFGEDEEELGLGAAGASNETIGPALYTKRRKRKEQLEPIERHDSSDLSEDSDEEMESRPLRNIKFSKMPLRHRAGSSPLRDGPMKDGPAVLVVSPSRLFGDSHLRTSSVGSLDIIRPRRNTGTTNGSSENSSENELENALFQRRPLHHKKGTGQLLANRIQEDERESHFDEHGGAGSDSSLSSALLASADSGSMLVPGPDLDSLSSKLPGIPRSSAFRNSPKKPRSNVATLHALPPPRPISTIAPVSLLSQILNAKNKPTNDPFARFASLSGHDDPNPLYIKLYMPSCKSPGKPMEMLLHKVNEGLATTVSEAIGFALWRYCDEKLEPKIPASQANVNYWNFRMVEDGEVEYDFPALARNRLLTDFTSNNNRGVRARSREQPWDEFALVQASEQEFKDNEKLTPKYSEEAVESSKPKSSTPVTGSLGIKLNLQPTSSASSITAFRNPITGPSFSTSVFSRDAAPLDTPAASAMKSTPRSGLPRTLNIRLTDENLLTRTTLIESTTDTYIEEVFDQVCSRLKLDKALYVLRAANSSTVIPLDRTIEALGDRCDLDLHRRRFVGEGSFGLGRSLGSSSPNAPFFFPPGDTPRKGKTGFGSVPALSQRQDTLILNAVLGGLRRYHVVRKQPMSFSSSSNRVITLDMEFIYIMPSGGPRAMWETQAKMTAIPFTSVVGCKVSRKNQRTFHVIVFKEKESKRYDFEAITKAEANEIVGEIRKGVASTKPQDNKEFV